MIAKLGTTMSRWASRWVPDPFVLALLLTAVVFCVGAIRLSVAPEAPEDGVFWTLAIGWFDGFKLSGGLAFALQMCFVLVTGTAMALSPPVQSAISRLAGMPRSAASATALVALVSCIAALVHWGLGAIAGALLARELGRHAADRGLKIHYPLLGAAAYAGMAVWHGGLSGSAPLKVAEAGDIALGDMLGSTLNLVVCGTLLVAIPALFAVLTPKHGSELVPPDPKSLAPLRQREDRDITSPVMWLQESASVGRVIGSVGLAFVVVALAGPRMSFDINSVNLLFLFLGLTLQGSLRHYVEAVTDGAKAAGAIIIQFPLYFGILGLMKASGMVKWISDGLVELSAGSKAAFPIIDFFSAGLVNMFVPSGGGQWAVQKDILLEAGAEIGVDPVTTIMAFSYGDAWTNMLQPFWALPLLGIMGLRAKDIIGYTATVFLLMLVMVPVLLVLLS